VKKGGGIGLAEFSKPGRSRGNGELSYFIGGKKKGGGGPGESSSFRLRGGAAERSGPQRGFGEKGKVNTTWGNY